MPFSIRFRYVSIDSSELLPSCCWYKEIAFGLTILGCCAEEGSLSLQNESLVSSVNANDDEVSLNADLCLDEICGNVDDSVGIEAGNMSLCMEEGSFSTSLGRFRSLVAIVDGCRLVLLLPKSDEVLEEK